MTSEDSVRDIVLLGGGGVTSEYYLPALAILGLLEKTAVAEVSEGNLRPLKEAFPGIQTLCGGFEAALDAHAGDARARGAKAIVALPNSLHVAAVTAALTKGFHVLCEKPLALHAPDCAELRMLADAEGRVLKVAMSRRYLPTLMLAKDIVASGEMGAVRAISVKDCSLFRWQPRSFSFFAPDAGGILADMGVHYLDYLDSVAGPLEPLGYSDDSRGGNESSLLYRLRAGGIDVRMRLSRLDPAGAELRFVCARGDIVVEKSDERAIFVLPVGGAKRRVALEQPFSEKNWPQNFHGSFCELLRDFDRAIAGKPVRIADAADAERAVRLIEWAYEHRAKDSGANRPAPGAAKRAPDTLITGASGFIGGHLVERLWRDGISMRAAVRSPGSCANLARYPLEIFPANLLDPGDVKRAVEGVRTVYHLAYGRDGADARDVTIQGTKTVVEAAIAAGAECVVILSTMYVFGFPETTTPVDETFPYRPYGGEYGQSKAEMERWCLKRAESSGKTRIVVLNPTSVFGPGGGAFTTLPVTLAKEGQFCWVEGGRGTCNYTYVENVVDAMKAAASVREAHGRRFIVTDGHMDWKAFLEPLVDPVMANIPSYTEAELRAFARSGPRFSLRDLASAAIASPQIRDVARRSKGLRAALSPFASLIRARRPARNLLGSSAATSKPSSPPDWLASLYSPKRTIFSARKANDILHWTPRVGYGEALTETLAWLSSAGYLPEVVNAPSFADQALPTYERAALANN